MHEKSDFFLGQSKLIPYIYIKKQLKIRDMARKYERYQSIVDGDDTQEFEKYWDALSHYKRGDAPKTLFGVDEQGEYSVIFTEK